MGRAKVEVRVGVKGMEGERDGTEEYMRRAAIKERVKERWNRKRRWR